jgi:hypothetical protein
LHQFLRFLKHLSIQNCRLHPTFLGFQRRQHCLPRLGFLGYQKHPQNQGFQEYQRWQMKAWRFHLVRQIRQ